MIRMTCTLIQIARVFVGRSMLFVGIHHLNTYFMYKRNTIWECIIVVRGMPSAVAPRSIGLQWRDFHIWDPDTNESGSTIRDCGKAYVTVYKGNTIMPVTRTPTCVVGPSSLID